MMNGRSDEWTERLSEYLDGDMDGASRAALESHLSGCARCVHALRGLEEVRRRASELGPVAPPRDLWPAIEADLRPHGTKPGVRVLPFPEGRGRPLRGAGRVSLSVPQLTAAAVAVMLASAATTWVVGPGLAVRSDPSPLAAAEFASAEIPGPPEDLARQLRSLEDEFTSASRRLDPETLRVIEKNLAVIERAIDDSRRALATDPGNTYLEQHLDGAYERKLTFLREARQIPEWSS